MVAENPTIPLPTNPRFVDLTGETFNRLTVIGFGGSSGGRAKWICRCECGATCLVVTRCLRTGHTKSCGCLQAETMVCKLVTHGHAARGKLHYLYGTWAQMKQRCTNPKVDNWPHYGGRGITVCDRWLHSFPNFLADMGDRPSDDHEIERVDNDGPYAPDNCVWATRKRQVRNRRVTRTVTHNGRTTSLADWAEELGLDVYLLSERLRRGWSVEEALTTPLLKNGQRIKR